MWIFGGEDAAGDPTAFSAILDPQSGRVDITNAVGLAPRAHHQLTLLDDGNVLISGGRDAPGHDAADNQLWSPMEKRSIGLTPLVMPRSHHDAALLPSGRGLIWGGSPGPNTPESFDPVTRAMSQVVPWDYETIPLPGFEAAKPEVVASQPADGALGVGLDPLISLRFSKWVDIRSINAGSISLVGPSGVVPGKVTGAEKGLLGFYRPLASLLPDSTYTLFVEGVVDRDGRQVSRFLFSFRTRRIDAEVGSEASDARGGLAGGRHAKVGGRWSDSPRDGAARGSGTRQATSSHSGETSGAANGQGQDNWRPYARHRGGQWAVLDGDLQEVTADAAANRGRLNSDALRGASGVTAVAGWVRKHNNAPVPGIEVRVGAYSTRTDAQGRFLLSGIAPEVGELIVNPAGEGLDGARYTSHRLEVRPEPSKTHVLEQPIYLAKVLAADVVRVPSPATKAITLTHPEIPGLELEIPSGAVLRTPDGKVVNELAIVPIPVNRAPFRLPAEFPVYLSVQPAGVFAENPKNPTTRGIRVTYPNFSGLKPGTRVSFWNYDPHSGGWRVYGQGTVSRNGKRVVPDAGVEQQSMTGFGYAVDSTTPPPLDAPPPGGCTNAGDPVDCATGLFSHHSVDLVIADVIPIVIARTYRTNDAVNRTFGPGHYLSYDNYLYRVGEANKPTAIQLVQADGSRIVFERTPDSPESLTPPGSPNPASKFVNQVAPTAFQGAQIMLAPLPGGNPDSFFFKLTLKDGSAMYFGDHSPNALIRIEDRNGNYLKIARESSSNPERRKRITRVTSPSGRYVDFTYRSDGLLDLITDNTLRTVDYVYTNGRLTSVSDPEGHAEQYDYYASGNMWKVIDKRNNTTVTNDYYTSGYADGRVQTQTMATTAAGTAVWQFAYDVVNGQAETTVTDPNEHVTKYQFNSSKYLVKEIRALGTAIEQTYKYVRDPVSQRVTLKTDARLRKTAYDYDDLGNLKSITRLSGTATPNIYLFDYDPRFNLLNRVTDPLGHSTRVEYDERGNPFQVIDALGHAVAIEYDDRGQPTTVTDGNLNSTVLSYLQTDISALTDADGRQVQTFNDALGRLGTVTDELGNRSQYLYDRRDLVTQVFDARNGETKLDYDEEGNLRFVTDPREIASHSHEYQYDELNRVKAYINPVGKVTTYEYDLAGNLNFIQNPRGYITKPRYDELNRPYKVLYPSSETLDISFDNGNRPWKFVDSANGTVEFAYDELDRVHTETTASGVITYEYDDAGRRRSMQIGSGNLILYEYWDNNLIHTITQDSKSIEFVYDDGNRLREQRYSGGTTTVFEYTKGGLIDTITYKIPTGDLGSIHYTYDDGARRTSVTGTLATYFLPDVAQTATFNDANRLAKLNGQQDLTYDFDGNLKSDGVNSYTWNSRDQLVSISGGVTATFTYDALGRRYSKQVGTGPTQTYQYDAQNTVREYRDGTLFASYLTGLSVDTPYWRSDTTAGQRWYLPDALGSTVGLTTNADTMPVSYKYGPYGQASTGSGNDNRYQFTGRENDDTGLQYNRARYYSPTLGRFISEDPIGLGGGINTYAYVGGDPVTLSDPTGLFMTSVDAACLQSPDFCAEMFGDIVRSAGAMNGNHCSTDAAADLIENFGHALQFAVIAGSIQAAATTVGHGHHPIPKFLGGNPRQLLSQLDSKIHREFHSLLRENLKAAGIPLKIGGRRGKASDWAQYMTANPGAQRKALDAVLAASRSIDARHGTNITQDVWQNVIDGKFITYP